MEVKEAEELRSLRAEKSPVEAGRPEPRQGHAEVGDSKKRVQLAGLRAQREVGREDARHLLANFPASVRRACELTLIPRSTFRFQRDATRDEPLRTRLVELAQEKPRFGYRRLLVLMRWDGMVVNHKRLFRIYRSAGLSVKRKRRKRLVRACSPRMRPTAPNEEWSLDFVHDRLASGRAIRVLGVVDTFTRECLALEVDTSELAHAAWPSLRLKRRGSQWKVQEYLRGRIRLNGPASGIDPLGTLCSKKRWYSEPCLTRAYATLAIFAATAVSALRFRSASNGVALRYRSYLSRKMFSRWDHSCPRCQSAPRETGLVPMRRSKQPESPQ